MYHSIKMCGILCLISTSGPIDITEAKRCLELINNRGPDAKSYKSIYLENKVEIFAGFAQLKVMEDSITSPQPYSDDMRTVMCNGEIYNYQDLVEVNNFGDSMANKSDCGVLLPLYEKFGLFGVLDRIDAEHATVIYDKEMNCVHAVRDVYGIRPLYFGQNKKNGLIGFSSELKAIHPLMDRIVQVKPNMLYTVDLSRPTEFDNMVSINQYYSYPYAISEYIKDSRQTIMDNIRLLFTNAVAKRLNAKSSMGFLLSGGLDSSLIVSVASRILGPENITCFTIGFEDSPDVKAAKQVAEFLGIENLHIVPFDPTMGFDAITDVIRTIETYDITTIRASVPQYLIAKYIQNNMGSNNDNHIRVLLSGEGSDELHGSYRYFRDAPNPREFREESIRLLEELYMFDNQRTDRTMAAGGLEVRIPFLDTEYVDYILSLDPKLMMHNNDNNKIEKLLLRDAFQGYLPKDILHRSKEAFSDAVSSPSQNWAEHIKTMAYMSYSDDDIMKSKLEHNNPETIDSMFFRKIFDEIYPNRANVLSHFWMPKFQKTRITDPSARVLDCY